MKQQAYLAFDLGAESGRAMLATLHDSKVTLHELHRFPNTPQRLPSGYHWNLTQLWADLIAGLRNAGEYCREHNLELRSLGVDTWGVDFGLIGKSGQLLGLPYAYRDERHPPAAARVIKQLGEAKLYNQTGLALLPFNTLFQLTAQHEAEPATLDATEHLLLMPDLLHYFFSGEAVNEATIASTSQMIDLSAASEQGAWATELLDELSLPHHFLGKLVPAGTRIGTLRAEVCGEANVPSVPVIVPGSHDTASAIAAVPVTTEHAAKQDWAYLSSGTWSLLGAELDQPVLTDAARVAGFTNERGVGGASGGKIRFLKNISGLWLVQQVRRDLAAKGRPLDYAELTRLASEAEPMRTLIDPSHAPFAEPGDMLAKLRLFASDTGQPPPESPGQCVRACLESLALTYRQTLANLERLLSREMAVLHIVGGGGKNTLLNQMTADAIRRPVLVGPEEATAIGNALTQAIGAGDLADLEALRAVVRASFDVKRVEPRSEEKVAAYDAAAERFAELCQPQS